MSTRMARFRLLRRLAREDAGASLIEFGLLAPLLCFVLLAIVDIAQGYSLQLQLKQATDRTVELATVKGGINGSFSYLQAEGMAASGQPSGNVTATQWLECNTVRMAPGTTSCSAGQSFARYVGVTITATYTPMFSAQVLSAIYRATNTGGVVTLSATSQVRVQ